MSFRTYFRSARCRRILGWARHFLLPVALHPGWVACILLLASAQAQAPADVRIALVIGNSAYPSAPLVNPANDARAMGDTLRGLGFVVTELRDGRREQMTQAIVSLREALKDRQGVGMLYYAGHGVQMDARNYMVPVDAQLQNTADVVAQTVDVGLVVDALRQAGTRMNILVLDACRDNPFGGITTGKGLAPLDAPSGTFLAYATAPGNVADDGDVKSGNGLYTQFLLDELKKPTSRIEDVFKRVRLQVRQKSQGRQIPWESTSLEDDFYFNTGKVMATARPEEPQRAQAFSVEKADWDRIRDSKTAGDVYAFLQKYPSGSISQLAEARLEVLDKARIAQTPGITGRFRDGDRVSIVQKDGYTGVEQRRYNMFVRRIGEDDFEGSTDAGIAPTLINSAGFIRADARGSYDPPYGTAPGGEFQVGKKWNSRSTFTPRSGPKGWVEVEGKVVARETITVPAGTFETFKVEVDFLFQSGERRKSTLWFDPEWGIAVRLAHEFRPRTGAPDRTLREMISRQRGG